MNTFQNIFLKFFQYSDLNKNNILIFNFYFTMKLYKNLTIQNKFKFFKTHIINNKLLNNSEKESMIYIFSKTQLYYYIFSKLAFKFKIKKSNLYDNQYDLNYNKLDTLSNTILITIFDGNNNLKYLFRISDLINIINSSLSYMENFHFYVNEIKNPYTNIPFNLSTLYNIYFLIKKSSFIMPYFFHLYFLSNFNKDVFYKNNESLIKSFALNRYYNNIDKKEKINIIKEMLKEFKNGIFVIYDENLLNNDEDIIKIFEPCIKDYLFLNYSSNILLIMEAKENLKKKMLLISTRNILTKMNININIDFIQTTIENYIISHLNNNTLPININANNAININPQINNNILQNNININNNINQSINRRKIYRIFLKMLNTFKKYNNYLVINYPIIINIIAINIFIFRLYISYKFSIFIYFELISFL